MRITGSNFSYQHTSFERFCRDMVDLELPDVEIWGVAPHLQVDAASAGDVRRLRTVLDGHGLRVRCLTPEQVVYPVNIASGDDDLRRRSVALFRRAADIAADLGSPLLFLTPGRGYEDEPVADAWRRSAESLREIVQHAASRGIDCVLEPLQRRESNLIQTTGQLRAMLDDVGIAGFGVALDTVAMACAEETVDDYVAAFGIDGVRHVHLIDGNPAGHLVWGEGRLPLEEILNALSRNGYSGWMTFELFGDGDYALDPRAALERCLRRVRPLLEAVPA
ncbi:sugar phosphate isomerase/epimerase family protein [Kineococcus sp. SYSU DK003]|uniref:sugar phosphate isomerase/epimerase family protein n=1 Tax=Kineococcus sp. SYSU DK003 TaxID=3383124 RepID=UPI003D7C76BE